MAGIWSPNSAMLREPPLLIPGERPVGPVRSNILSEAFALNGGISGALNGASGYLNGGAFGSAAGGFGLVPSPTYAYAVIHDTPGLESAGTANLWWQFVVTYEGAGSSQYLFRSTSEAGGSRTVRIHFTSTTNVQFLIGDSTGNWVDFNITIPLTLTNGSVYRIVMVQRENIPAVRSLRRSIFINGLVGHTEGAGSSGNFAYKDTTADWTLGETWKGAIHYFAFGRGLLPDAEYTEATKDPMRFVSVE